MPEMLVKIVMQIYSVGHDEAEEMLLAEPPDSSDADWYEALMMLFLCCECHVSHWLLMHCEQVLVSSHAVVC